jgi:hypothetical protein
MTTAPEQPKAVCTDVITACDKALEHKNKQIKLSDLAISQQKDIIDKQAVSLAEKDAKLNAFYRSPIFLIGVGVVGALLLGKLAR